MTLDSTAAMTKMIVARLLDYVSPSGATLQSALGTAAAPPVYVSQVPDDLKAPYVLLRVLNQRTDDRFANTRLTADAEVIVFVRPRAKQQQAEAAADLVVQALVSWRDTPGSAAARGLLFGQRATRDTLPVGPESADREVVMIRVLASFVAWPRYLTALSTS